MFGLCSHHGKVMSSFLCRIRYNKSILVAILGVHVALRLNTWICKGLNSTPNSQSNRATSDQPFSTSYRSIACLFEEGNQTPPKLKCKKPWKHHCNASHLKEWRSNDREGYCISTFLFQITSFLERDPVYYHRRNKTTGRKYRSGVGSFPDGMTQHTKKKANTIY
jgi:hypothetical protein